MAGIPQAEAALVRCLSVGGDYIPLILKKLNDEWLTSSLVRGVVTSLRGANLSENVDFQAQIAQLDESQIALFAWARTKDDIEPSEKYAAEVLKALERAFREREGAALLAAISQAPDDKELLRKKMATDRRIKELKTSRKGNELGD
jgi:hypothetical protein